jgi:hypothetical protein
MNLDRDSLKKESEKILGCVTNPRFLEQLEEIRRVPRDRRIGEAAKRLTPDALRKAGVDVPEGVRLSSRYFEQGEDFNIELGELPGRIPVVPAIESIQPGFLDRLRVERPDLFSQLVRDPQFAGSATSWSVCGCVGGGFCAGIGGGP